MPGLPANVTTTDYSFVVGGTVDDGATIKATVDGTVKALLYAEDGGAANATLNSGVYLLDSEAGPNRAQVFMNGPVGAGNLLLHLENGGATLSTSAVPLAVSAASIDLFANGSSSDVFIGSDADGVGVSAGSGGVAINTSSEGPIHVQTSGTLHLGAVGANGILELTGTKAFWYNLPTADPAVAGQLWNSAGTLKISAG